MENNFAKGFSTFQQAEAFAIQLGKHGYEVAPRVGTTSEEKLRATTEDWERNGTYLLPWEVLGGPQNIGDAYVYKCRLTNGCDIGAYGLYLDMFSPNKGTTVPTVWARIDVLIKEQMASQGIS